METASKKYQLEPVSPKHNQAQKYVNTAPRYFVMNSSPPTMYKEDSLKRTILYPKEKFNSNKGKLSKRGEYYEGSQNISSKHTNKEVDMSLIRKVSSLSLNKNNASLSSKYSKPCVAGSTCIVSLFIITGL